MDISLIKSEFSNKVKQIWKQLEARPTGQVEVLIGANKLGLHPKDLVCRGNIKVMTSLFGGGYVFGGTHSAIKTSAVTWSQTVSNIRCSLLTSPTPIIGATVNRTTVHVKPTREFFEAENLGIMPPRRCNNCMNCRDCSFRAQQLSQRDQ